ncbi:GNAT family N-acetyltransferase [Novosphingobium umbonatum]|uniref:GNAT family N-acetyltransferase n=1 Tax=Novosphingobium umbonatum TaxID=1908524 RepID=A0A3S2Y4Y8_9SPHN|nr:GNAT family N-acetyltransferase [Novosphingobium umbonatum]RVU02139.1 GNAT family N-acetyltransferase [Novosphingobium umbonatum]
MEIVIRQAEIGDCTGLNGLIIAHAAFEHGQASLSHDDLLTLLTEPCPASRIIVAASSTALLGYAALTVDFSLWRARYWAHLDCLFVHEDCRGQAIGGRLFDAAKALARTLGVDSMEWQTPSWNENAAGFYRAKQASCTHKMRFFLPL